MKNQNLNKKKHGRIGKPLVAGLALGLVMTLSAGATLAWLTDVTEEVKNTFTTSGIEIGLDETKDDFRMVPGYNIDKDPYVTVEAGSEDCWLFVKVMESDNLDDFIEYSIDSGWTELEEGVYCRKVTNVSADITFPVLSGDTVLVKEDVTDAALEALTPDTYPTLSFKSYAVQLRKDADREFSVDEAWEEAQKLG